MTNSDGKTFVRYILYHLYFTSPGAGTGKKDVEHQFFKIHAYIYDICVFRWENYAKHCSLYISYCPSLICKFWILNLKGLFVWAWFRGRLSNESFLCLYIWLFHPVYLRLISRLSGTKLCKYGDVEIFLIFCNKTNCTPSIYVDCV